MSALVGNLSAAQQRLERDAVEMREHLKATVLDAVMPDDYQPPTYPEVIDSCPSLAQPACRTCTKKH